MSRKNRNPNPETTMDAPAVDPIDAAFAAIDTTEEVTAAVTAEQPPEGEGIIEDKGPTAKQMAEAEEANVLRQKLLIEQRQREAEGKPPEQTIIGLAAQGMDVLHDAIRAHSNQPSHPEYIPPPRTERQMTALEEELEAGRRTQQRAEREAQIAAEYRAKHAAEERAKEGFTTPVHRPADVVPNPMGGNGTFTQG